jgi:hypothetical protein
MTTNGLAHDGLAARVVCLPSDYEFGAFEDIHGEQNAAMFVEKIRRAAHANNGQMHHRLIQTISGNEEAIRRKYEREKEANTEFLIEGIKSLSPIERRIAGNMVLPLIAVEHCINQKLLPWKHAEARSAIKICYRRYVAMLRSHLMPAAQKILAAIKHAIISHEGTAANLSDSAGPKAAPNAVFLKKNDPKTGQLLYCFYTGWFEQQIFEKFSRGMVLRVLKQYNLLELGSEQRPTKQHRIPQPNGESIKRSFYTIHSRVLDL